MSRHLMVVLYILLSIAARSQGASAVGGPEFEAFWRQALVQLQSWPAEPRWHADTVTFVGPDMVSCQVRYSCAGSAPGTAGDSPTQPAPVLYLLDRADAQAFEPGDTHSWMILDVGAQFSAPTGAARLAPTEEPAYRCVQLAQRALALLIERVGRTSSFAGGSSILGDRPTRIGLVGEGRGASVALALAALLPHQVAFVAAHEPVDGPAPYFELKRSAGDIRCPTLLSYGGRDRVAPETQVVALSGELNGETELVEFPRAAHCQAQDLADWSVAWRQWANALL